MAGLARNAQAGLPESTVQLLADYNPTQEVLDLDVVEGEVGAVRSMLAGNPANVDTFASGVLRSLQKTAASGQPVSGEILGSKDPLSAVRIATLDYLKRSAQVEELPEGVFAGTATQHVREGWILAYSTRGNGKGPILQNGDGAGLTEGVEVKFTLTGDKDRFGHPIAVLYQG